MIESLLVYISLAGLLFVCGNNAAVNSVPNHGNYSNPKSKKIHLFDWADSNVWLIIIAFSFVFGCRYNVGIDWEHYLRIYNGATYGKEYEFLFELLTSICSYFNLHYCIYFSIIAFLEIFLIYYAFRERKYIYPYIPLFLIFGFWFMSLCNIMRQQIAASIFLVAVGCISNKKPVRYMCLIVVAMLFHKSAALLFVVYFLYLKKDSWFSNPIINIALFIVSFVLSFKSMAIIDVIEPYFLFFKSKFSFDQYGMNLLLNDAINDRTQFGNNTGYGSIISLAKYLPLLIYGNRMKDFYQERYFNILYDLWFIGVCSAYIFGSSIILTRPFVYFQNYMFILPAFYMYYAKKSGDDLAKIISVMYVLLYFVLLLNLLSNGDINTSSYSFFWQH